MSGWFHVAEGLVPDPAGLARALRPLLGPHPAPQSHPDTRGLMLQLDPGEDLARLPGPLRPLVALLAHGARRRVVAVNETPPTSPDAFAMRPHLDRVDGRLPSRTLVAFVAFPAGADGGELVVFPPDRADACAGLPRDGVRAAAGALGTLVRPVPGRVCSMAGDVPHAVMGHAVGGHAVVGSAGAVDPRRVVVVVAEF